ncbi:MAG: hypothetical protein U1C97_01005, partial [Candidatus Gracilibacteria bacterium]|nr:hypothetical protein [Candidatus Gracilibacteria bacterium]
MSVSASESKTIIPLKQLFLILWQSLKTSFKNQVWWSLGMLLGVLILHTFFLVYLNEGWKSGPWDGYLVTVKSWASATISWTILSGIVFLLARSIIEKGLAKTLVGILSTPLSWSRSVEQTGIVLSNILLLFSASLTILLSSHLFSIADLALTLWFMVSIGSGLLPSLIMFFYLLINSLSKGKLDRHLDLPKSLHITSLVFLGASFGFLLGFLIEQDLYLAIAFAIIAVFLLFKRKKIDESAILTGMLIMAGYFFWKKHLAFADDGGWDEAGSTLAGWLNSDGAFKTIQFGLWPSFGTALAPPATDTALKFGEELKKQIGKTKEIKFELDPKVLAASESANKYLKEIEACLLPTSGFLQCPNMTKTGYEFGKAVKEVFELSQFKFEKYAKNIRMTGNVETFKKIFEGTILKKGGWLSKTSYQSITKAKYLKELPGNALFNAKFNAGLNVIDQITGQFEGTDSQFIANLSYDVFAGAGSATTAAFAGAFVGTITFPGAGTIAGFTAGV